MQSHGEPTAHGPGSEGKMRVLSDRYFDGQPLWHPDDATEPRGEPHRPTEDGFGSGVFFEEEEE